MKTPNDIITELVDRCMAQYANWPERVKPSRNWLTDFLRRGTLEEARKFVEMVERGDQVTIRRGE